MNIFECWKKIQIHFLVVTVLFILMTLLKFVISDINTVYYIMYVGSSLVVSVSCLVLGIKHSFLWYYTLAVMFFQLIVLWIAFLNDYPQIVVNVFLSNFSAAFVMSAIGAIIHKIRENNKADEDDEE